MTPFEANTVSPTETLSSAGLPSAASPVFRLAESALASTARAAAAARRARSARIMRRAAASIPVFKDRKVRVIVLVIVVYERHVEELPVKQVQSAGRGGARDGGADRDCNGNNNLQQHANDEQRPKEPS